MRPVSRQVIAELINEEMAKLLFFLDRHRRWGIQEDKTEVARQHRIIADALKDVAQANQNLLDLLEDENKK